MDGSAESTFTMGAARVLLGWLDAEEGIRVQHGSRADAEFSQIAGERLRIARERVAVRRRGVDQRGVVAPPPEELAPHVDELRRHPATEQVFAEGWSPSLVDLRRVCAFQSRVFTDAADERVRAVEAGDPHSIATVSLPIPGTTNLPACFDPARGAWVLTSPSPNLRVVGHFTEAMKYDATGFGFAIAVRPSFVSAVNYGGRYYLLDGYHRAVAFLRRGITHVPALTRTLHDDEPFSIPPGMLPPSAYLGERPPRLADFLHDDVSMSVVLPMFRKVILIQALEVMA